MSQSDTRAPTILIVDDEGNILDALTKVLKKEGYDVRTASHGRAALEVLRREPIAVMLTDLRMPGLAGDDLLRATKKLTPEVQVVVMTAYGTVENAVEVMKNGAFDFLSKPIKRAAVTAVVRRALDQYRLVAENRELKARLKAVTSRGMVGNSQVMRATLEVAEQVAQSSATVLILGESGTGKEGLARFVHRRGSRAEQPFIATNCAAIPESLLEAELFGHERGAFTGADRARKGRFQEASGGTLFLDEIGELPMSVQVKLLRVIQEGEVEPLGGKKTSVDLRLICATNRDLAAEVKAGRFREDLYYRINVVPVTIPPLRDRLDDVPLLADHFLRMYTARHGKAVESFDTKALELMCGYAWPGNVRELENVVERAVVLAKNKELGLDDLPPALHEQQGGCGRQLTFSVGTPLEAVERRMIAETLKFTGDDKRLAAELLGIATRTIYRKLEAGVLDDHKLPSSSPEVAGRAGRSEAQASPTKGKDEGVYH